MGHDIYGYNNKGEEVAYARFSMGNHNATILYRLLDSIDYHAGVSGNGESTTFSIQHLEKALCDYRQLFNDSTSLLEVDNLEWDQKQIRNFILNCLETAQKEGKVDVFFG